MKKLSIAALTILTILFLANIPLSEIRHSKEMLLKDSTITWYNNRYLQDSALLRDLAILPSEGKHDQVVMIFKMNNRNVKSYK